ncbi:MAG: DUF397 domain-containing protein [Pseudonocardiaceae bacterium]
MTGATWRKATYGNGNGGDCVEVAHLPEDHLPHRPVRLTKRRPGGRVPWIARRVAGPILSTLSRPHQTP